MASVSVSNEDMLELLLTYKPNVNIPRVSCLQGYNYNNQPIACRQHVAWCMAGNSTIVNSLLSYRVQRLCDSSGIVLDFVTPLCFAASKRSISIVRMLVEAKADVNYISNEVTLYNYSSYNGYSFVIM